MDISRCRIFVSFRSLAVRTAQDSGIFCVYRARRTEANAFSRVPLHTLERKSSCTEKRFLDR